MTAEKRPTRRGILELYRRLKVRWTSHGFKRKPYLQAYSERTDALTELDEKLAIGDLWDEMGRRQYDFLVSEGLSKHHKFLDIGCGTLRGGRFFIDYLDIGNYRGFDISEGAIRKAKDLIAEKGLGFKEADVRVNKSKDLKFTDYTGQKFDFLLAQSVFSHLMEEHIEEAFSHIRAVMHPESKFYFTFHMGDAYKRRSNTDFQYPMSFFMGLAERYGFKMIDKSEQYEHPRGQAMMCASLC